MRSLSLLPIFLALCINSAHADCDPSVESGNVGAKELGKNLGEILKKSGLKKGQSQTSGELRSIAEKKIIVPGERAGSLVLGGSLDFLQGQTRLVPSKQPLPFDYALLLEIPYPALRESYSVAGEKVDLAFRRNQESVDLREIFVRDSGYETMEGLRVGDSYQSPPEEEVRKKKEFQYHIRSGLTIITQEGRIIAIVVTKKTL